MQSTDDGDVMMTNGLRVSPDGTKLYHNDTLARVVWVTDLVREQLPSGKRVFCEVDGQPDGMAIDSEGGVWIALVMSGRIVRLGSDGRIDEVLDCPRPVVSAVCFGGDDLRDLYVTTFGAPYDTDHTGSVLRTRVDRAGLPCPAARI